MGGRVGHNVENSPAAASVLVEDCSYVWNKDGSLKFSATIVGLGFLVALLTIITKALPERFLAATGIDRVGLTVMGVGTVILLFRIAGCVNYMK